MIGGDEGLVDRPIAALLDLGLEFGVRLFIFRPAQDGPRFEERSLAGDPARDRRRTDDVERRAVFLSEGLGHAFCALEEGSAVTYLVSSTYDPAAEHTVSPLDPDLALSWPAHIGEIVMSEKDLAAPSLASAAEAGRLPSFEACRARYDALRR